MKFKIVFITLGLALLIYILICIREYLRVPKDFTEAVEKNK